MNKRLTSLLPFVLLAVGIVVATGQNAYVITVVVLAVIWSIFAVALNFLLGYSGLLNLGLGAFAAIGAYGAGILTTRELMGPWAVLFLMPIVVFIVSMLIGPLIVRTSGFHFAIVTMGIGIISVEMLSNLDSLTNGTLGLGGIPRPAAFKVGPITVDPSENGAFLVVASAVLLVVMVGALWFHRSRAARIMTATEDDQLLAQSMGFNVTTYRVWGFALSNAVAAIGGVVYAWHVRYISPDAFGFEALSFEAFLFVIIGGIGTVWGPVIGAAFLVSLPEFLDIDPHLRNIVYALVLLFAVFAFRHGILGNLQRVVERRRVARERLSHDDYRNRLDTTRDSGEAQETTKR